MHITRTVIVARIILILPLAGVSAALAQTIFFTYQGKLAGSGDPANGNYVWPR